MLVSLLIVVLFANGAIAYLPHSRIVHSPISSIAKRLSNTALHLSTADFKNGMTFEVGKKFFFIFYCQENDIVNNFC